MITVEIHESTPANMLRAIRAACNELLGEPATVVQLIHPEANAVNNVLQQCAEEARGEEVNDVEREPGADANLAAKALKDWQADQETDSDGHAWNAELHASTKSKNADGTWKKRRGAAQATEGSVQINPGPHFPSDSAPTPPLPPAAPTAEPIMPKIFALITSQIVTINQAVEAAQAEGYADLGANGLGGAPVEKQLAVLRKLEAA